MSLLKKANIVFLALYVAAVFFGMELLQFKVLLGWIGLNLSVTASVMLEANERVKNGRR